jgi:1,4-alpha-glucan branching enzyme
MGEGRSVAKRTMPGDATASASDVEAVVAGRHGDVFRVLGLQQSGKVLVARCFIPDAETVAAYTLAGEPVGELSRRHPAGFFEGTVAVTARQPLRYLARNAGGEWRVTDPYSFGPVLGPMDDYYIAKARIERLFDKLGAHVIDHEGASGVHFAVWAPNARASRSWATSTTGTAAGT